MKWLIAKRQIFALVLIVSSALLRADPTPSIIVPPAPVRPSTQGVTSDQQKADWTKWRADYRAWEASLTAEQRAERKRLDEEASRRRHEEMERMERLPLPADGYTWKQAAEERKIDPETVDHLGRDKVAYGPTVKQSFSPYFGGPIFITSDSILNGFHVLFEDAFRNREVRQIAELKINLETVIQQARANLAKSPFPAGDVAAAWRHAQLVVGPALGLLGSPLSLFDPDAREEIQNQMAKVKAAQSVELPAWLGPATVKLPALDYRTCKPVGFYTQDEKLADYFRAVRWLQLIPFRMDRDVELAAIGMLGYGASQAYRNNVETYFRSYSEVLGETDDPGMPEAADEFQNFLFGQKGNPWAASLLEKKRWLLRDSLSRDAKTGGAIFELPVNAQDLLSKIQFKVLPAYRLPDKVLFQQLADKNLEPDGLAVAAMLGSSFASDHFSHFTREQFESAMGGTPNKKDKARPRETPSLYDDYLRVLSTLFIASPSDAPAFMRSEAWQAKSNQTALGGWAQIRHTFSLQAQRSEFYFGISIVPPGFVEPNPEFFSRLADLVERARGVLGGDRERWDTLASVTRKLEALAHKELRLQPWSLADERFLKTYGEKLGFVMGYAGNSYEAPNDDAPRWAEVHHNAQKDLSLAVAVGRPRLIYILYPWNGMEILCTGSVMPYYEYESKERLTDAEWQTLLDSPKAPHQPEWLQPYIAK